MRLRARRMTSCPPRACRTCTTATCCSMSSSARFRGADASRGLFAVGPMPHHAAKRDLLAGGLYLQLGMHNEAGRALRITAGSGRPGQREARSGLVLPRQGLVCARLLRSHCRALQRIEGTLPPAELEAERCTCGERADAPGAFRRRASPCSPLATPADWDALRALQPRVPRCCAAIASPMARRSWMPWAASIPWTTSCWRCGTRPTSRWARLAAGGRCRRRNLVPGARATDRTVSSRALLALGWARARSSATSRRR
jgi:hypothetical protein